MAKNLYPKLAATNIKNHSKTYVPYIIASIFTIMMYYIMGMLYRDEGMTSLPESFSMILMIKFGSYVVGVLSIIFLFYVNSFLIKRRKKEFGLLNVLGMEKRHIAKMIFFETLYVAVISLVLGLLTGIIFSKLLQLLLLKLMTFEVQMGIHISLPSIISTLILFLVIYLLSFLNNLRQIHLSNPTELLQGGQVGEREPKTKWIMTIIGVVTLGAAYYIALTTENPLEALTLFFIAVLLVIVGTYSLFTAGSIALLKLMRKNKKYYYKTKHFISVSGMIYRMKQNAAGLATICIMSTCVIIMISTTVSLYLGMEDALRFRYPQNIYFQVDNMSDEDIVRLDALTQETLDSYKAQQQGALQYRYLYLIAHEEDGNFIETYTYSSDTDIITLIPLEDYNRVENQSETLEEGQVLLYATNNSFNGDTIRFGSMEYAIKSNILPEMLVNEIDNAMGMDAYLVVLPDAQSIISAYKQVVSIDDTRDNLSYYYGFDSGADSATQIEVTGALAEIVKGFDETAFVNGAESARAGFLANYGGLLFLGIFLGLLFIMCTVLIIYYKQISEGYDDKGKFEIMQNVGLSRSEVKQTIRSQVMTVFFLPLIAAGVHVAVSFKIITKLLALLNLTNVTLFALCTLGTILVFALLYALVYSLTAREYYKIVK